MGQFRHFILGAAATLLVAPFGSAAQSQQETLACPEPPEYAQLQQIRSMLDELTAAPAATLSKEEQQARGLVNRLKKNFGLRDEALLVGDCDTSNQDREIIRLAGELDALTGDVEPDITEDRKDSDASPVIMDATAAGSVMETADGDDTSLTKFLARFLNYALSKHIKKERERELAQQQPPQVIPVAPPQAAPPAQSVLRGSVRAIPASATGSPAGMWDRSRPVQKAKVHVKEWDVTTETDGNGEFTLVGRARPLHITISAPGYDPGRSVLLPGSGEVRGRFLLKSKEVQERPKTIAGVVKTGRRTGQLITRDEWEKGRPMSGALVRAPEWGRETRTDANGRFVLTAPAGKSGPVKIVVTGDGRTASGSSTPGREARIWLAADRPSQAVLRGVVKGGPMAGNSPTPAELARMRPVGGAVVTVPGWGTTTTRNDGFYEIRGVPGDVTIEVKAHQFGALRRPLKLQPGNASADIYLRRM